MFDIWSTTCLRRCRKDRMERILSYFRHHFRRDFLLFFLFAWSVAAWKTYQCKSIARWQILSCTFYSVARLPDQIFRLTYSRCLRVVCECCWWWWMVALLRYVACNHISSGNANELLIWYFKVFRSFTCEQSDEFSGEAGKDNYRTIVHASKV